MHSISQSSLFCFSDIRRQTRYRVRGIILQSSRECRGGSSEPSQNAWSREANIKSMWELKEIKCEQQNTVMSKEKPVPRDHGT